MTQGMLMSSSMRDLDLLRLKYKKAQDAINGRVLERPSEDPQRVVEAMDLTGAKMRFERTQRTGQDAREWLAIAESHMTTIIEHMQSVREIGLQAGGPVALTADARESLARGVETIREALMRELNAQYRGQYIFAGWATETEPFANDGAGGVSYLGTADEVIRDIAPNLPVSINIAGSQLLAGGDFMATLTRMAEDIRTGDLRTVITDHLSQLTTHMDAAIKTRSDLGVRYATIERYENYAEKAILGIEERLGKITGADLEVSYIKMTEAQTAYQTALVSFSKVLPTSLLDYMLR